MDFNEPTVGKQKGGRGGRRRRGLVFTEVDTSSADRDAEDSYPILLVNLPSPFPQRVNPSQRM